MRCSSRSTSGISSSSAAASPFPHFRSSAVAVFGWSGIYALYGCSRARGRQHEAERFIDTQSKSGLLLVSLSTVAGSESSSQTRATSQPIRQIDDIMIRTGDSLELYTFFAETLQLPIAWPMTSPRAGEDLSSRETTARSRHGGASDYRSVEGRRLGAAPRGAVRSIRRAETIPAEARRGPRTPSGELVLLTAL
jgi:hypothetical protein